VTATGTCGTNSGNAVSLVSMIHKDGALLHVHKLARFNMTLHNTYMV
jgi:hypothetical protein